MNHRKKTTSAATVGIALCLLCTLSLPACRRDKSVGPIDRQLAVAETERAFAKTMADRDLDSFRTFLSEEAVFLSGESSLRGKKAIVDAWSQYFDSTAAPFSWAPARVEVLESGMLAFSTGPVYDSEGNCIATFNSVWREEASGVWRIVFDCGTSSCE